MWKALALWAALVSASGLAAQDSPAAPRSDTQITAPVAKPDPAVPFPTLPSSRPVNRYIGMRVEDIQVQGVSADQRVLEHLNELIVQKKGQPLDMRKVRESIHALYATGRIANIQLEADQTGPQDVTLIFRATPTYFIGALNVSGAPKRPTANQLIDSAKLHLGEPYTRAKADQAVQRMKSVMAENGYYESNVAYREAPRPDAQQMDIDFEVIPGPAAHIGKVIIEGEAGYTPAEIADIADLEPGHTVTAARLTKGLQKLRKRYSKKERLEAQISVVDKVYHEDSNTLDYVMRINRGPTVGIHVEGGAISTRKLKKYVPVYEEHAVDNDLLNEGRRNIRDYLQTKGYFDAEVNYTLQPEPEGRVHVVYLINRGPRHDLVKVELEGNKYFPDELIRERLQVQSASWLLSHGRFSQVMLTQDVDAIAGLYKANGFDQVQVKPEVIDDYRGNRGDMAVIYHITEGPQTRVASIKIEGNNTVPESELLPLMNTQDGQPYSQYNVALDQQEILNYYFNHGFPDVQFASSATPVNGDPKRMAVVYTITEGPQVFIDRILTSQLEFTRPYVVQRQFAIHPGDPLGQSDMLKTQKQLYDLGVFNEVQMGVQNPDGRAKYKDVLLQFQEAKRWTFNYGVGVEASTGQPGGTDTSQGTVNPEGRTGVSPRVSFEVTRINFRGLAHTLSFKTHVGRLQRRAVISYEAPRFWDRPDLRLTFTGFYDNSINVTTFTSQRLEGSMQLEQNVSRVTTLLYRFTYRLVKATDVVVSPDQIPLLSRPVRVGMPSFSYIRDKRDEPIDTHNGNYTTFDAGVASSAFGSEASFGRVIAQNSTYHPFRKKRWVFARNLRLGMAEPFASTVIPLPERFLAGGAGTLRGFALNQAGPRDVVTGFPLGGDALVINNLELRFPPLVLPFLGDNLSLAAFHDAGNVFRDTTTMFHSLFRWNQPQQENCRSSVPAVSSTCRFDYISHSLGMGFRYKTPIGPVRVDVGYNLNPTAYPVCTTFDAAGACSVTEPHRTRRFNFFFSIGQTF